MSQKSHTKYIIVSGGVISGIGKGVTTASIGKICKGYGHSTTLIKIDPYINFDAGTLRPTEHGEVWVTHDGGEIDQDLGTYERFINQDIPKKNSITTGQVYKAVIDRERRGEYLGQTVQFIPHITNEITDRIKQASEGYDVAIIEIGGIVGDYENVPFLFALKTLERELGPECVSFILVTYLPVPEHIDEMKTKPTQQAIKMLSKQGIFPDFIVCRSRYELDEVRKKKIEVCANISSDRIIAAPDIDSIYRMPLIFEQQGFGEKLFKDLHLSVKRKPDWSDWQSRVAVLVQPKKLLKVAIIGKYLESGAYTLSDSYVSVDHALKHAGAQIGVGIEVHWLDAKDFENNVNHCTDLALFNGVIIPGGFGMRGVEGKMNAITYIRQNNIPFLGICYGMQLAAIEYARNVCNLKDAHTTEVDAHTPYAIIDILALQKEILEQQKIGGTMRLGSYNAQLKKDSCIFQLYMSAGRAKQDNGNFFVSERHRHRYEVNPLYVSQLQDAGLVFSGFHERSDGTQLMEFLELSDHPYFIATQAHPEFNSRFDDPSPLFYGFVKACEIRAAVQKKATKKIKASLIKSNQAVL